MKLLRKIFLILILIGVFDGFAFAQKKLPSDVLTLQDKAHQYLTKKDYTNSIMLLNQAIRRAPDNVSLRRDLAYAYFLSGKLSKADKVIQPVLNSQYADEQTFQIAAAIQKADGKNRKARKTLNKGLNKFPSSGLLYYSLGNLLSQSEKRGEAIKSWEKGIRKAPDYSQNYYSAAKYYHQQKKYVWTLIYGEIYANLTNSPKRSTEIKKLMVKDYQSLLSGKASDLPAFGKNVRQKSTAPTFETDYKNILDNNVSAVSTGFDAETLTMLRTRFLMVWRHKYANTFHFSLFSWQNKLIHAGYFDAYNQWLFGAVTDSVRFNLWIKRFANNYKGFQEWRHQHPYRPSIYDPKP